MADHESTDSHISTNIQIDEEGASVRFIPDTREYYMVALTWHLKRRG